MIGTDASIADQPRRCSIRSPPMSGILARDIAVIAVTPTRTDAACGQNSPGWKPPLAENRLTASPIPSSAPMATPVSRGVSPRQAVDPAQGLAEGPGVTWWTKPPGRCRIPPSASRGWPVPVRSFPFTRLRRIQRVTLGTIGPVAAKRRVRAATTNAATDKSGFGGIAAKIPIRRR